MSCSWPSASRLHTSSAAATEPPDLHVRRQRRQPRALDRRGRGGRRDRQALLGLDPLPRQPPFFWSDQFGLRLQLVGDTTDADEVEVEGSQDSFVARYRATGGKLVAALASNRPADVGRLRLEVATAA